MYFFLLIFKNKKHNLKVIYICENLDISFGGPASSIPRMCHSLRELGVDIEIEIVKNRNESMRNDLLDIFNLTYEIHNSNIIFDKFFLFSYSFFKKIFSKSKTKENIIFHINGIWRFSTLISLIISRRKNIFSIISPRGMLFEEALSKNSFLKKIYWNFLLKKLMKNSSIIHATSELERELLSKQKFDIPIVVIPHGIDHVESASKLHQENFDEHKGQNNESKIIFLARLIEHKGLHIAIEMLKQINEIIPRASLFVGGEFESQSYKARINKLIKKLKISDNVHFLGELSGDSKEEFFNDAELLVLPSKSENFGMSIAEALGHGIPVVTSKNTPWKDLDKVGIGRLSDLKIDQFAKNSLHFLNMSKNEKIIIKEKINSFIKSNSWEIAASKMIRNYLEILK